MCTQGLLEVEAVLGANHFLREKEMLRRIELCVEQPGNQFNIFIQGPFDFIEHILEALPKGTDDRICVACTVHIAGTRMSEEGSDGLSQGCLSEGVMHGVKMSEFIPLHLTAFKRSPALEPWLRDWAETGKVEHQFDILKSEG